MPEWRLVLRIIRCLPGRLQIILRGGNRGVVAVALGNRRMSYGDLRSICLIGDG